MMLAWLREEDPGGDKALSDNFSCIIIYHGVESCSVYTQVHSSQGSTMWKGRNASMENARPLGMKGGGCKNVDP